MYTAKSEVQSCFWQCGELIFLKYRGENTVKVHTMSIHSLTSHSAYLLYIHSIYILSTNIHIDIVNSFYACRRQALQVGRPVTAAMIYNLATIHHILTSLSTKWKKNFFSLDSYHANLLFRSDLCNDLSFDSHIAETASKAIKTLRMIILSLYYANQKCKLLAWDTCVRPIIRIQKTCMLA